MAASASWGKLIVAVASDQGNTVCNTDETLQGANMDNGAHSSVRYNITLYDLVLV